MTSRPFPRLLLAGALLAGAAFSFALPIAAQAATYISVQIGPPPMPVEVVPAARPGYIWAPGFYQWQAERYQWRPGHWERARPGQVYVPARWHAAGPRWEYRPAHWRASGPSRAQRHVRKPVPHRATVQRHQRPAARPANRGLQQVSHSGRPARR